MFKSFKAVGVVCGVVACKDNGKVGGCSDGCIVGGNSCKVVVVVWVFGWVRVLWIGVGKGRELSRRLYPDKNRSFLIPF